MTNKAVEGARLWSAGAKHLFFLVLVGACSIYEPGLMTGASTGSGTSAAGSSGAAGSANGGGSGAADGKTTSGGSASTGAASGSASGGVSAAGGSGATTGGKGSSAGAGMGGGNDAGGSACAGQVFGGLCWYLGPVGQSCDVACAVHDGVAEGSEAFVGTDAQGGSLEECQQLLALLGVSAAPVEASRDDVGVGCHLYDDDPYWLNAPVFATDVSVPHARLVCACR